MKNNKNQYRIYMQFVLIGAALGLYYGVFYRGPQTPPDYLMALILSVFAALITVLVRSWKKKRTFREILFDFLKVLLMFSVFMISLELRKVIFERWGKTAVIIFTTSVGILVGLGLAVRKKDGKDIRII